MLKRLAGKTVQALPDIVGRVAGAMLSFLGRAVGLVAEYTRALIICYCRTCWLVVDIKS